jgi:hypothetical protein
MNMKTMSIILTLAISANSFAQAPAQQTTTPPDPAAAAAAKKAAFDAALPGLSTGSPIQRCTTLIQQYEAAGKPQPQEKEYISVQECYIVRYLSPDGAITGPNKENSKNSMDGKITCKEKASYTQDLEECEKALKYYNAVVVAETAMNLQQTVRTDLKNQSIQKKAQAEMAQGQSQTSMFDAASASNNHQKSMQQEKMLAYAGAVAALVAAHRMFPSIEKVREEKCPAAPKDPKITPEICASQMNKNKGAIIANDDAKNQLMTAIMEFTAKGVAAGIAMGQYGNAAKQIEAAKSSITDEQQDMMMEACVLNPTDPACSKQRNLVSGQSISSGDFGAGDMGANSSFNLGADSEVVPEMGGETNLDENAPIAGVNSPFVDDAKLAKGILDPASAAQMQASGGAAGGGGGGGGGLGGGGASLGSDLNGANKDGDKEAQIKTNKVSGAYAQGGGAGYKGVGKSKDDANPFASLFDAKGNGGGVEEDRSIASGDIDGAASGLFQKISKRYNQIQADKRIEAKNLE